MWDKKNNNKIDIDLFLLSFNKIYKPMFKLK